ncbi:MAG TPA: DUF433 domain-containing protein [Nakamurella sp.]
MDRIVIDPAMVSGMPCVRGTRIPVTMVVGPLAENVTVEGVLQLYPQLTAHDVRACRAYAAAQDRR